MNTASTKQATDAMGNPTEPNGFGTSTNGSADASGVSSNGAARPDQTVSGSATTRSATTRVTSTGTTAGSSASDTQTISITSYTGYSDDHARLAAALQDLQMKSVAANIAGDAVTYRLLLEKGKTYRLGGSLQLSGAKNLIVDGNGSTLVYTDMVSALSIVNCSNVAFQNLSIDYNPLPFTQGVVTAVNGNRYTVEIDEGYRKDLEFLNRTGGYDNLLWVNVRNRSDGSVVKGTPSSIAFEKNVKSLGGNLLEFTFNFSSDTTTHGIKVGDVITINERTVWAIYITGSSGTAFRNFNLYAAPGFGMYECASDGGTILDNVRVVPGPKPEGATQNRLLATNADGTHFVHVKSGPTVTNSRITNTGDDCLNIHGTFYSVISCSGKTLLVSPKADYPPVVGDTIEGFSEKDFLSIGSAKITDLQISDEPSLEPVIRSLYEDYEQSVASYTRVYRLTLDKELSLKQGDHVVDSDRIGSNAVVKNTTLGCNRARGVLIGGHNVTLENNTILNTTHSGIVLHAELWWNDGPFPVDVTVKNNKVHGACLASDMLTDGSNSKPGAIFIGVAPPDGVSGFSAAREIKGITIEGNTITDSRTYGIFAENASGITIRNNVVTNPFADGLGRIGEFFDIIPDAGIFVAASNNVVLANNTVRQGAVSLKQAIQMHSSAQIIQNVSNSLA